MLPRDHIRYHLTSFATVWHPPSINLQSHRHGILWQYYAQSWARKSQLLLECLAEVSEVCKLRDRIVFRYSSPRPPFDSIYSRVFWGFYVLLSIATLQNGCHFAAFLLWHCRYKIFIPDYIKRRDIGIGTPVTFITCSIQLGINFWVMHLGVQARDKVRTQILISAMKSQVANSQSTCYMSKWQRYMQPKATHRT